MKTEARTAWDRIFAQSGRVYEQPHPLVSALVRRIRDPAASRVLDVGSGSGRHLVFLAALGCETHGIDNSPHGIRLSRQWLKELGLRAHVRLHDIATRFPYPGGHFDAIVSVQVIHHAVIDTIRAIAKEIDRVSKPGALLFVTVPRLRNQAGEFREIEPNTFLPLDGPEKGLPHHFFSNEELAGLFPNFEGLEFDEDALDHLCLTATKRKSA